MKKSLNSVWTLTSTEHVKDWTISQNKSLPWNTKPIKINVLIWVLRPNFGVLQPRQNESLDTVNVSFVWRIFVLKVFFVKLIYGPVNVNLI